MALLCYLLKLISQRLYPWKTEVYVCHDWLVWCWVMYRLAKSQQATLKWRSQKLSLPGWSSMHKDLNGEQSVWYWCSSFFFSLLHHLAHYSSGYLLENLAKKKSVCLLKYIQNFWPFLKLYQWYISGIGSLLFLWLLSDISTENALISLLIIHNNYHLFKFTF